MKYKKTTQVLNPMKTNNIIHNKIYYKGILTILFTIFYFDTL